MKVVLWVVFLVICGAESQAQNNQSLAIDHVFERLIGHFDNFEQEKSLPDSISRTPARSGSWLNPLCLVHLPVEAPALGTHVLFLEWREASCDGSLNRQRIWSFRVSESGELAMNFYSFKPDMQITIEDVRNGSLKNFRPEDLVAYPEGCTLLWSKEKERYIAHLDAKTCHVTGQLSGREMSLEALIEVDYSGFNYFERGVFISGEPVFTVPGLGKYRFVKWE